MRKSQQEASRRRALWARKASDRRSAIVRHWKRVADSFDAYDARQEQQRRRDMERLMQTPIDRMRTSFDQVFGAQSALVAMVQDLRDTSRQANWARDYW